MPRDVNLVLDSGRTVSGDETLDAIDVEGGFRCDFVLLLGAMTGGTTLRPHIEASINGGTNYFDICTFPLLDANDDDKRVTRCGFVPRPTTAGNKTKLRVRYDDTGGMTSVIQKLFCEPLLSIAPPNMDVQESQGLCYLT